MEISSNSSDTAQIPKRSRTGANSKKRDLPGCPGGPVKGMICVFFHRRLPSGNPELKGVNVRKHWPGFFSDPNFSRYFFQRKLSKRSEIFSGESAGFFWQSGE
jgi:hypothetical protein